MAKTIQSKKFWIQTLFASTGAVVAGPAGSLIGGLVGELVVQVLPGAAQVVTSVTTGLIGETIPQLFGALGSDLTAGSSDQINHNLQTAFREACLRGLYDLGGSACFKAYWRSAGYNETQALAYFSTPEGRRLLHSEPDLADQIREHLLGMEREIQERWFASLDAEKGGSLDVTQYLHAELPAQKARAFFDTVLGSYLKQAGGLEHEFPGFVAHLRRHYMDRVLVHLGEQVKADDTTWRAFNRELL